MNGSRQRYRLDDYLQDKAARSSSPLSTKASPLTRKETYSSSGWARPAPVVNASGEVIVRPPHTVQRPSGSSYNASNAGGGQNVTVDTFKPDAGGGMGGGVLTQSQMTTAYTKQLMENALSNLLAMQNRKFKYDAHSSPLYSIVQKQAEENARLASGRAYAQAKAATGGYGSSYATLAADEAGRQAMRELDDQQLALYEAARSEFEAENASALDWYNTTKQLYEDAYMLEQDAKANAPATITLEDGTTVEVTDAARELYAGYLDSFTQGTGYDTLKTAMINGGASEADADQAIAMFKKLEGASIADKISSFEWNPTLDTAQEIWDEARRSGKEKEYLPKLSAGVSSMSVKNLDAAKTDEEEAAALLDAKAAFEAGYLTAENYADVYVHAVENDIKKNSGSKKKDKYKNILKNYGDISELAKQGQIPAEIADKVADWLVNETNISDNFVAQYDKKGNVIGYSVQSALGPFAFTKKEEELLYDMITHKLTKEKLLGIQK